MSSDKILDFRQNYKLDNLVTFHKNDKRINTNIYLHSETGNGIHNLALNGYEVAISKQIADKLGIKSGDQVEVDLPIYDEPQQYTVSQIIPYISNYFQIEDNLDFAVAFLGYSEKIEHQVKGEYATFLTTDQYDHFKKTSLPYNQRYDVHNELNSLKNKSVFYIAIFLVALLISITIYHLIISKIIKQEVAKYLNDCFELKIVRWFYYTDFLIYSFLPLVIVLVFGLLINAPKLFIIGYAFIIFFWTLWWLLGGKCFEKAD